MREKLDIEQLWTSFDGLPPADRTKPRLLETFGAAAAVANGAGSSAQKELSNHNYALARKRLATLVNPKSYATGERNEVLVPSDDSAEASMWGSQWANDENAPFLRQLGFTEIRHPEGKVWKL